MEQLSNKDKKELFMSMVEKAKNGTLESMRMTNSKEYDRVYSQLRNNIGPFGLVVSGITKDGKISVYLSDQMTKQIPTNLLSQSADLKLEEAQLSELLDNFYDMNNMQILNEFFKVEPDYLKTISLQEYRDDEYNGFFDKLVMLNALDYLSQQPISIDGRDSYSNEDGLRLSLLDKKGKTYIALQMGDEISIYDTEDIRKGTMTTNETSNPQFKEYISTFLQSVEDLPKVYEAITNGTYKREDFISTLNSQEKQTALQQKESELSTLEAEAKTISEAEALIDRQNEGQNIGE